MTTSGLANQAGADQLLNVFQANRHLSPALREREIDRAILLAANANNPGFFEAHYDELMAAVHSAMAGNHR